MGVYYFSDGECYTRRSTVNYLNLKVNLKYLAKEEKRLRSRKLIALLGIGIAVVVVGVILYFTIR